MADPARYDIDPVLKEGKVFSEADLHIERSQSGQWVKWHDFQDYKAGQRRNRSEATAIKLGLEIVHLKTRIEDLELEVKALREGRDAIGCLVNPAKVSQYLPKPNAAKEGGDAK